MTEFFSRRSHLRYGCLTEDSDNRQILRMLLNTQIWRAVGVIPILLLTR